MTMPRPKLLTLALAAILAVVTIDAAAARHERHRLRHHAMVTASTSAPSGSAFWSRLVPADRDGNPVIMKGFRMSPVPANPGEAQPQRRVERPIHRPRGGSSFVDIPPVNPSPYSSNSPTAAALTHPIVQPYNPPHITTFSDRVTNAIHDYPLQNGIGNNPTDQQSFIRQRANQ
jgi:hypothetical protein